MPVLIFFLFLSLLACNGSKDESYCADVTDLTSCGRLGYVVTICCTDDDVCLVGITDIATGDDVGYKSICYDGMESTGCLNAIDSTGSMYCSEDSGL